MLTKKPRETAPTERAKSEGQDLAALVARLDLTQREISHALGISEALLSRMVRGHRPFSAERVFLSLLLCMHVHPDEFMKDHAVGSFRQNVRAWAERRAAATKEG